MFVQPWVVVEKDVSPFPTVTDGGKEVDVLGFSNQINICWGEKIENGVQNGCEEIMFKAMGWLLKNRIYH